MPAPTDRRAPRSPLAAGDRSADARRERNSAKPSATITATNTTTQSHNVSHHSWLIQAPCGPAASSALLIGHPPCHALRNSPWERPGGSSSSLVLGALRIPQEI